MATQKKRARGRSRPELTFGGAWDYAPAPEATDHVEVASRHGLFVGGAFVRPRSGKHFSTVNPATGQKLSEVAQAGAKDVDLAVQAAQKALPAWRRLRGEDRARSSSTRAIR